MRNWNQTNRATVLGLAVLAALPLHASNVVTDWNAIASTTIVTIGGKAPAPSEIWFAYTGIAMYDAVNAITGEYRPFYYQGAGAPSASVDAAAAAAAHRVLVNYFPAQQTNLDTMFANSIKNLTATQQAKDAGVAVGEAAAAALIAARSGDGLEANVTYTPGTGPGAWQPTPPAFAPALAPWLGQMRPFTMASAADYLPGGPPALDSEIWNRDYRLTWSLGGFNTAPMRSGAEREIGLFWTEHAGQQYARAFGYLANSQNLTVPQTARLMAMLWTGAADAVIGCFNAKYKYGFWRPVTAINAGGGPNLTADASWQPLGVTPNHPEYPAAHGCVTGAVSEMIAGYFGTTKLPIVVDSLAFQDGTHTHTFQDTRDLMDEVFWARMYAGFHYHHSLEVGRDLGTAVARGILENHFRLQFDAQTQ
jgi:hypothetical protein